MFSIPETASKHAHDSIDDVIGMSEADLMRALRTASEDVLRLAAQSHEIACRHDGARARATYDALEQQHALAEQLIDTLLALPAVRA
jgi:hypothetical protein